jgi:hypothetical protein
VTTVRFVVTAVRSADSAVVAARQLRSALAQFVDTELYLDDRVALGADERRFGEVTNSVGDVLVYHHGGLSPAMVERIALHAGPVVVVLHQPLPGLDRWRLDEGLGSHALRVERGLRELAVRAELAIAPTDRLASQLAGLGFTHVELARIRPTRFATLAPDPSTLDELQWRMPSGFVLAIDAIVPSARHDLTLQAVHLLQHVHGHDIGVVVAGASHDQRLMSCLHRLVAGLHVDHAWFGDRFDERALAAVHQQATLAITFGEADDETLEDVRALSLPVISCGTSNDGDEVYLPPGVGPAVLTEALLLALVDGRFRDRLVPTSGADESPRLVRSEGLAEMVLGLT